MSCATNHKKKYLERRKKKKYIYIYISGASWWRVLNQQGLPHLVYHKVSLMLQAVHYLSFPSCLDATVEGLKVDNEVSFPLFSRLKKIWFNHILRNGLF